MKKLFVSIAVVAMMFTSCKKYDVSEEIKLESLPTVTIQGFVYAKMDNTLGSARQPAPTGTAVIVSIPYSSYGSSNAGNLIKSTTLDAKGHFEVTVPVCSKTVTATISFADFIADVKSANGIGQEEMVKMLFTCGIKTVSISGVGDVPKEVRAEYNLPTALPELDPNAIDASKMTEVTVSGKLTYKSIDSSACTRPDKPANVPEGTKLNAKIKLTIPGTSKVYEKVLPPVTVGASGKYSIKVPMTEMGEVAITLIGEGFWTLTKATPSGSTKWKCRYEINQVVKAYNADGEQSGNDAKYDWKNDILEIVED